MDSLPRHVVRSVGIEGFFWKASAGYTLRDARFFHCALRCLNTSVAVVDR